MAAATHSEHRGIDPRYARSTSCAKVGLGERCRKSGGAEGEAGRRHQPSNRGTGSITYAQKKGS